MSSLSDHVTTLLDIASNSLITDKATGAAHRARVIVTVFTSNDDGSDIEIAMVGTNCIAAEQHIVRVAKLAQHHVSNTDTEVTTEVGGDQIPNTKLH